MSVEKLMRWGRWISSALLVVIAVFTTLDALLRYVFAAPIFGSQDLQKLMLVIIIMFAIGDGWLADVHVRMTMIYEVMNRRLARVVDFVSHGLGLIMAVALIVATLRALLHNYKVGTASPLLHIPGWVTSAIILIGAVMLLVATLKRAFFPAPKREEESA